MQSLGLELIEFVRCGYRPVVQEDIAGLLIDGGNPTKVCGEVKKNCPVEMFEAMGNHRPKVVGENRKNPMRRKARAETHHSKPAGESEETKQNPRTSWYVRLDVRAKMTVLNPASRQRNRK